MPSIALLIKRADDLADCIEASPEGAELVAIADAKKVADGKVEGGKG